MNLLTTIGRSSRGMTVVSGHLACVLLACTDTPATAPETDAEVILTPTTQWAGGVVEARSSAFRDLVLIWAEDSLGDVRPNRYTNLAVIVDSDTVDSWQTGEQEVSFRLPNPKLSGTATVEVRVEGQSQLPAHVDVVGKAWPIRFAQCSSESNCPRLDYCPGPIFYHGVALPNSRLLALFYPGSSVGIGVANLDNPTLTLDLFPGLRAPGCGWGEGYSVGLVAPGDAIGAQEWILDVSPDTAAVQPMVWRIGSSLAPVRSLECLPEGMPGAYAVAELPTGDCLVLTGAGDAPGALLLNGDTPVPGYEAIPPRWSAGCAAFRSSPGNRWLTFRSLEGPDFCWSADPAGLPAWPVFGADGDLSFSSRRYGRWVRGADFTPDGDPLWVVGATPEWSLDAWDPATGELLSEFPLEGLVHCDDVLVDPLRPYVYIACRRPVNSTSSPWAVYPSLMVFDRAGGEIVAILDSSTTLWPFLPPIALVYGGSSGRVHVTGVWDGTTVPFERGVTVISWDIR